MTFDDWRPAHTQCIAQACLSGLCCWTLSSGSATQTHWVQKVAANMPAGHGLRARTRDTFSRPFKRHGYIPLGVYLRTYKMGDLVDIKVNAAVQKVGTSRLLRLWGGG